jgi:hypothetical protein
MSTPDGPDGTRLTQYEAVGFFVADPFTELPHRVVVKLWAPDEDAAFNLSLELVHPADERAHLNLLEYFVRPVPSGQLDSIVTARPMDPRTIRRGVLGPAYTPGDEDTSFVP